jgi:hypothetical protein
MSTIKGEGRMSHDRITRYVVGCAVGFLSIFMIIFLVGALYFALKAGCIGVIILATLALAISVTFAQEEVSEKVLELLRAIYDYFVKFGAKFFSVEEE